MPGSSQARKLCNIKKNSSSNNISSHGLILQIWGEYQISSLIFSRLTRALTGKICHLGATPTDQASHLRGVMKVAARVDRFSKALAVVQKRMLARLIQIRLITGKLINNCREIISRANTTLQSITWQGSTKCLTLSRSPKIKSACSNWVKHWN